MSDFVEKQPELMDQGVGMTPPRDKKLERIDKMSKLDKEDKNYHSKTSVASISSYMHPEKEIKMFMIAP